MAKAMVSSAAAEIAPVEHGVTQPHQHLAGDRDLLARGKILDVDPAGGPAQRLDGVAGLRSQLSRRDGPEKKSRTVASFTSRALLLYRFMRCRSAGYDSCPINLLHAALPPEGTSPYITATTAGPLSRSQPCPIPPLPPRYRVGLYVRLEAKPGQEDAVAAFLKSALPIVEREPATITWYAMRLGPTTFGIDDTFPDDQGREAHLRARSPPR